MMIFFLGYTVENIFWVFFGLFTSEKELIPISIEEDENEENTFIVKPKEELKKGEYAFYYIKDDIEPNNVYDFQISK